MIEKNSVPNEMKNFSLFEYSNNYITFLEVANKSDKEITVDIDCSNSENCLANNREFYNSVKLKPSKNKLVMVLCPQNPRKNWCVRCNLIKD